MKTNEIIKPEITAKGVADVLNVLLGFFIIYVGLQSIYPLRHTHTAIQAIQELLPPYLFILGIWVCGCLYGMARPKK